VGVVGKVEFLTSKVYNEKLFVSLNLRQFVYIELDVILLCLIVCLFVVRRCCLREYPVLHHHPSP